MGKSKKPKTAERAKATLTIEVDYSVNDTPISDIMAVLRRSADFLAGEGLFSGDLAAEVRSWSAEVTVKPVTRRKKTQKLAKF